MFTTIQGSAHDITQVADKSVQLICTSPPYYGLRAYDGEQAIEWATVEYAPMPGLPPIRVQGCEPGCNHEWADGKPVKVGRNDNGNDIQGAGGHYPNDGPKQVQTTRGAYCIHCGGWRGGLGLEPDPFAYVGHLILCLREWRRVLRDDGLCFVNLGDSYAGSKTGNTNGTGGSGLKLGNLPKTKTMGLDFSKTTPTGFKPKDLMQIPQRFALAAQADGWFVRNDIIWSKPNPMPESVQDRFTRNHEYIYMLAKSERYYFDAEAVREPNSPTGQPWGKRKQAAAYESGIQDGHTMHRADSAPDTWSQSGRNRRTVWELATRPFGAAHFACFPPEIPEICIRAGTSARGACSACSAPWRRVVEAVGQVQQRWAPGAAVIDQVYNDQVGSSSVLRTGTSSIKETTGWEPTCSCPDAGEPVPCTVLDPFSGSGTTGKVAVRLGRRYIGVDLSEKYLGEITDARMGAGVQMELSW